MADERSHQRQASASTISIAQHKVAAFDFDHPDLHVDLTVLYEDRQTLHRIRIVMFTMHTIMYTWDLSEKGWTFFPNRAKFFTWWGMTMVWAYLFWVVFYFPKRKQMSKRTIIFQQAVVTCETMISLVFWTILAPSFGFKESATFSGTYDHLVPLLIMLHEVMASYGTYDHKGELLGVGITLFYGIVNIILAFGFDIIVYPTPYTDSKNWRTYIAMPFNLLLTYGLARSYRVIKKKIVKKFHLGKQKNVNSLNDKFIEENYNEQ